MLKYGPSFKSTLHWGGIITFALGCFSCATQMPIVSHSNYLSKDLPVKRFEQLGRKIEQDTHEQLQTRGEAHVTVITPPEWDLLKDKLTMADIERIARKNDLPEIPLEFVCVGVGEKMEAGHILKTYFVVVHSEDLVRLRQQIQDLHAERDGQPGFEAKHFYPHVTIGFTDRDLHEQDGVIKDKSSCDYRWKY